MPSLDPGGATLCYAENEEDTVSGTQICVPFSYLTRNQGSRTAGAEALGLRDESFMGCRTKGPLFPCFPMAVPALLRPAIWERSCSYSRGGAGLLMFLSMSFSSRNGPALYDSIGPLLFPVGDWSFVTILHSYMSPEGHNQL